MENGQVVLQKSGLILEDGEVLELALEAELWATSSNPLARLIGAINRFLSLLVGRKKHGYIIVTNKRLVEISQQMNCWCCNAGKDIKIVMPSTILEVGYVAEGTFCGCFCQAYHLYYEALTQQTSILLKGATEEEAANAAKALYNLVHTLQN